MLKKCAYPAHRERGTHMKKSFSRILALILVLAAVFTMMPAVFAESGASLETNKFSFTVGLGTKFKEIGLPETIYSDCKVIATATWNEGSYNGQKEGTYTVSGTAKLTEGGTKALTAYITVKDCGFRLPHMTEYLVSRSTTRRNGFHQSEGYKRLGCTPLFDENAFEDYTWNYRWYTTPSVGVAGKLFSTDKDCVLDVTNPGQYYYCKVTGTKDGVSTTLTSRYVYVVYQTNEDLMYYHLTANKDAIEPGDDFKLTATAELRYINGAFDQFYYSGVDNYIPHFTFSTTTKGVSFSEDKVIAPRGVANITVHTTSEVANVDAIDITVNVKTVSTSKIYYSNLVIDNNASIKIGVVNDFGTVALSDLTDEWYAPSVRKMLKSGYMGMRSANTFGANEAITRGELINILYRVDGFDDVTDIKNVYDDVLAGKDYVNAVLWAYKNKVTNGTGDFAFSPEKKLTRQEFATILYRFLGEPKTAYYFYNTFPDASQIADYAVDAMRWATNTGILKGNGGKLQPTGTCTRAMVAAVLDRNLNK